MLLYSFLLNEKNNPTLFEGVIGSGSLLCVYGNVGKHKNPWSTRYN